MDLYEKIIHADWYIFFKINGKWSNGFFDLVLPMVRESIVWIPLYLFLLVVGFQRFGWRMWYWIIGIALTAALTDFVSSQLIKENIMRLRPCQDPNINPFVMFRVKYCPVSSSFTSSHATNHFGVAMFIFITWRRYFNRKWLLLLFAWAALICYAQVYVGVHFPIDVSAGTALGCLLGYTTGKIFNRRVKMVRIKREMIMNNEE
jgi:undecaprenyl-diphosphatase